MYLIIYARLTLYQKSQLHVYARSAQERHFHRDKLRSCTPNHCDDTYKKISTDGDHH